MFEWVRHGFIYSLKEVVLINPTADHTSPSFHDILHLALIDIEQIREQLITLLHHISSGQYHDLPPLLTYLKTTMAKEKVTITSMIELFDTRYFICCPMRILKQLLECVSYLTIDLGNVEYFIEESKDATLNYAELLTPLSDILFEMDIIKKYLQNTKKELVS